MTDVSPREALTSAVRYWEPRRPIYNLVLLIVVLLNYYFHLPISRAALKFSTLEVLIILAVLANISYCAAYLPDVLLQMSGAREKWLKLRWTLLLIGFSFGAILADLFSHSMFWGP
jgi:hypothetical protein